MSSTQEFGIHHLEVWGVGPEPTKDEVIYNTLNQDKFIKST